MASLMKKGTTTSLISDGRKKVHTTYEDGSSMVEEYDINTDELLVRRARRKNTLGVLGPWEYEIGEPPQAKPTAGVDTLVESNQNPIFMRKDTAQAFQWRIRNLPYPLPTYQVTVDDEKQQIVVRTTNKKYFKRISIPDLTENKLKLQSSALSHMWANNTLIITYRKPFPILAAEAEAKKERAKLKPASGEKEGDVDCKQQ